MTHGKVTVIVPSTTANLGPGFDCLGMALQIENRVSIEPAPPGQQERWSVSVSGQDAPSDLPIDDNNLVIRAANRLLEVAGIDPGPMHLHTEIGAPLARGLGSSASAIVGGMSAANAYLGSPVNEETLLNLMVAMEGHPDNIVPCWKGGLTASVMLDGRTHVLRVEPDESIRCVLLIPDYELSTAKARAAIPKSVPLKDAVFNLARVPFVLDAIQHGRLEFLSSLMDDRLHQPYRTPLIAGYDAVQIAAENAGAASVCISGASPTILAITTTEHARAVGDAMVLALSEVGYSGRSRIVKPDTRGTVVHSDQGN